MILSEVRRIYFCLAPKEGDPHRTDKMVGGVLTKARAPNMWQSCLGINLQKCLLGRVPEVALLLYRKSTLAQC